MFSFSDFTKHKRAKYAKMIAVSETFIRVVEPVKARAHYKSATSKSYLPPSFDEIYAHARNIKVDKSLSLDMNIAGHLYYNGDRSAQYVPPVNSGLFMHWVVIMLNDSITDARKIANFKNCPEKHCMNPAHFIPVFYSEEKYTELFAPKPKVKKAVPVTVTKKAPVKKVNAHKITEKKVSLVENNKLNVDAWAKCHGKNFTKEAMRLSRLMCISRKITYVTRKQTEQAKEVANYNRPVYSYKCDTCNFWHLSKKKPLSEYVLRQRKRSAHVVY